MRYAGFIREQNRQMGLVMKLATMTGNYKKADRMALERQANAFRQYPVKKWLRPE